MSSLAFHYVKDFEQLISKIYEKLTNDGYLIFSQEHPINTCHSDGNRWTKDERGKNLYCNLSNYGIEGERETVWFVENVKKYHRTFSQILNCLISTGFVIEEVLEPFPTQEILIEYPEYEDLYHKPDFLIIKARKLVKDYGI